MSDCPHKHFNADVQVHRVVSKEDADIVGFENAPVKTFVFEASVSCAECGQPFTFLWDSIPQQSVQLPVTNESMRMGPWTDILRSTINAAMTPMPLEQVHVTNETGTQH